LFDDCKWLDLWSACILDNLLMNCTIRQCSAADIVRLLERDPDPRDARHHLERFAMQESGQATYLLAWRGVELAGRCTVLAVSKYDEVRHLFGEFPEMNALEARPPGQGTGTAIIAAAEQAAGRLGAGLIGVAVEIDNHGARRLYERLGYGDWGHGLVIDHWSETDPAGTVLGTNADRCLYLVKPIR
jgi:GNAT superfamily N-acetyltransferase